MSTTTVEAIYENGKLVLPQPLPLPERTHVRVTIVAADAGSDPERVAWLKVSHQSLMKTWENPEDDVFNDLLKE